MAKKKLVYVFSLCFMIIAASCSGDSGDDLIKDTEKPVVTCQTDINVTIASTENEAKVDYTVPNATDNVGATVTQTSGLPSGAMYPMGTTTNTFQAKDAAGNVATCSFDVIVTRDAPSSNKPYFIGSDPTPSSKKWTKVENLSDEFDGTSFDDNKWHRNPSTDGFNWIGRPPGLFESDNVTVSDGNLNITVEKFAAPKTVNNTEFTHGGAIVRSKAVAKHGQYYECRMKANKTIMSSTFWIAFKQNCNTGPVRKLELDIQECVGRVHDGTANWAADWANSYHSNAWRHQRDCDTEVNESMQSPAKTVLTEKNNSRFFVYGCWWKSPTEILFYLDGEYTHSITPPTDFDLDGYITMAIETYDWNPVDEAGSIFATGSFDDLNTKYDWIRTWKLDNI
ncbi:HYR domain-containing protein [Thalassobellus suaedae]|uniref:HYR domain-containing protein n=1 Tax=Thalassobellus suaedae TaxID=3074124 RepID=A0ABY9Y121_9FLAO|nr:HYR domain-containing protein [Flavobacteriaceae bacterium HL-DH10]